MTAAAAPRVLVDSDVLIWLARGNVRAARAIEKSGDWFISAVSYMELAQGCRNKAELKALQISFRSPGNEVLPITQEISDMACALVESYSLSHSLHLADALIAATAMTHSLRLLTGNNKHFSVVPGLQITVFKP